jgi:hypothetical protein
MSGGDAARARFCLRGCLLGISQSREHTVLAIRLTMSELVSRVGGWLLGCGPLQSLAVLSGRPNRAAQILGRHSPPQAQIVCIAMRGCDLVAGGACGEMGVP